MEPSAKPQAPKLSRSAAIKDAAARDPKQRTLQFFVKPALNNGTALQASLQAVESPDIGRNAKDIPARAVATDGKAIIGVKSVGETNAHPKTSIPGTASASTALAAKSAIPDVVKPSAVQLLAPLEATKGLPAGASPSAARKGVPIRPPQPKTELPMSFASPDVRIVEAKEKKQATKAVDRVTGRSNGGASMGASIQSVATKQASTVVSASASTDIETPEKAAPVSGSKRGIAAISGDEAVPRSKGKSAKKRATEAAIAAAIAAGSFEDCAEDFGISPEEMGYEWVPRSSSSRSRYSAAAKKEMVHMLVDRFENMVDYALQHFQDEMGYKDLTSRQLLAWRRAEYPEIYLKKIKLPPPCKEFESELIHQEVYVKLLEIEDIKTEDLMNLQIRRSSFIASAKALALTPKWKDNPDVQKQNFCEQWFAKCISKCHLPLTILL